jgi:hypothetical protein
METNAKKLSIALLTIATIFGACKKEEIRPMLTSDDAYRAAEAKPAGKSMEPVKVSPEDQIVKTQWKVAKFNPNPSTQKPYDYNVPDNDYPIKDYVFEFNKYDVVIAKHLKGSVSGKWNMLKMKDGKNIVVLDFGKNPFIAMNSHWKIKDISDDYIEMYNEVDGILAFEKVAVATESPKEK